MVKIELCTDKNQWEEEQKKNNVREFLQSYEWGRFQESVGRKSLFLRLTLDGVLVGQILGVVHQPAFGLRYLYFPRPNKKNLLALLDNWVAVVAFLKNNKIDFVRLEPGEDLAGLKLPEFTPTKNVQAHTTLVLDISIPEEDIINQMHPKTRYNIRLAQKKGVVVKKEKNIDIYWSLCQTTKDRDGFFTHAKDHYAQMLKLDFVHQLTAYYEGVPIVSNICINYGGTFTYLHGASSNEYRNVMAPYLVQWEGMKLGKELSCTQYDFWGVAPMVSENALGKKTCFNNFCWQPAHHYTGFTRFKVGFGGQYKEYPEALDIVWARFKYKVYEFVRQVRRKLKK